MLLAAQQGSSNSSCGAIHEAQQVLGEGGVFGYFTSSVVGVVCVWIQVRASLLSSFNSYVTLNKVKDSWSEPHVKGTRGSWWKALFLLPGSFLCPHSLPEESTSFCPVAHDQCIYSCSFSHAVGCGVALRCQGSTMCM